jgi:pyruvate dehydrogenase E2 component (dihydrolipoamide acetyltransferase)
MSEPDNVGHGATREPATPVPPLPARRNGDDRLRVSPLARRIAAEKRIDLHALRGSGPGGRIVKNDVLNAGPTLVPTAPFAALGSGQKEVIPLTKMRAAIAKNLVASKQNIPHFYESIDVDVEALSSLRARLNEMLEPEKIRLGLGDFIAKAVASALVKHPGINATFNGAEVTRHGDVHLGMAVSIPDGLIVPVLRNVQSLSWKEIRRQSADLVERARALRLKQEEMSGATFTVSNLGTYGIREFSAIINPPQVAILAIAAAQKRAVVMNDQIVARTMMTLTLSADHRVVDGAAAADFLRTLKSMLEEPALMLL